LLVGQREEKEMASVMKVIVGLEGSRCHHDGRPRPRGPWGKSCGAYMSRDTRGGIGVVQVQGT
jgi:hypothetical protein